MTRAEKTEIPGSNWVTHRLSIPWNMEGTVGMAQRQHLGSCKSIWTERERNESDREEGWGIHLTILSGRQWPRDNGLCFASVTDTVHRSCLAGGGYPCGMICSMSPLSSHGSLHVAGTLMVFKCLIHAHTILVGLVLSWKEVKRRDPHPFGWQLLGCSEHWGLWKTREGNPGLVTELLSCFHSTRLFAEGSYEKGQARRWGKRPQDLLMGHQKCHGLGMGWKRISRHETEWKGNKVY